MSIFFYTSATGFPDLEAKTAYKLASVEIGLSVQKKI